jgi:hypothetical protein
VIGSVVPEVKPAASQKPEKAPSVTHSFTRYVPEYWPLKSEKVAAAAGGPVGELSLQLAQTATTIITSATRVLLCVVIIRFRF